MLRLGICTLFALLETSWAGPRFYGGDAYKVRLDYSDSFQIPLDAFTNQYEVLTSPEDLLGSDRDVFNEAVKLQVLHLYGVFSYHTTPVNFEAFPGAIKEPFFPEINRLEITGEFLRVNYKLTTLAVFYYELIDREVVPISFYLPDEPTAIYQQSMPRNPPTSTETGEVLHPCTDHHDPSEWAFWYYWSPNRKGCPKKIYNHIHLVEGTLTYLPETTQTFPEYDKLFAADRKLQVYFLIGQDEIYGGSDDLGAQHFERVYRKVMEQNRKGNVKWQLERETYSSGVARRTLSGLRGEKQILLQLLYLDTEADQFDELAREALGKADVFVFSGHSYEGYYFDLDRLAVNLPKDRYQIMFFNACSTWSYYHDQYFAAKASREDPKGTKMLDLLTNGIGAAYINSDRYSPMDLFLLSNLLGLKPSGNLQPGAGSWQSILKRMTEHVGYDYTALTVIEGDEDNPTKLSENAKQRW